MFKKGGEIILPTTSFDYTNFTIKESTDSKNYKMHFEKDFIRGYRDELDAMKQVVYKILNTERFKYVIYCWNYGIELADLYGEPISYVCPELERRIVEALTQDDRIDSISNFIFDFPDRNTVHTTFIVTTVFGVLESDFAISVV